MNWQTEIINGIQVKFFRYDTQYGPNTGIEYLATRKEDGTFTVPTHDQLFENVPSYGEFENYREADSFADSMHKTEFPFVLRVAHNDENAWILYPSLEDKSIYIRI